MHKNDELLLEITESEEKVTQLLVASEERNNSFEAILENLQALQLEIEQGKLLSEIKCKTLNILVLNNAIEQLEKKNVVLEDHLKENEG